MKSLIFLVIILSQLSAAAAVPTLQAPFSPERRKAYLNKSLTTFKSAPQQEIDNLYQFISMVNSNRCQSPLQSLTLACLQEEAQRNCASATGGVKKRCAVLSDIVAVNKANEGLFLTKDERVRLSEKPRSYREAYAKNLDRKYALLATEFILSSQRECTENDTECLAAQLDQYCLKNADVQTIPWQACASSIIWFIGETH